MSEFQEDLIAELASLNMAVAKALQGIASIAQENGVPKKVYLETILAAGDRDFTAIDFWSIPADRRVVVVEKARARYADLIAGLARPG